MFYILLCFYLWIYGTLHQYQYTSVKTCSKITHNMTVNVSVDQIQQDYFIWITCKPPCRVAYGIILFMASAMIVLLLDGGTKSISQTVKFCELYECIVFVLEGICLVHWLCQDFSDIYSHCTFSWSQVNWTSGCLLPQYYLQFYTHLESVRYFFSTLYNPEWRKDLRNPRMSSCEVRTGF
jgi:hypothetical protein